MNFNQEVKIKRGKNKNLLNYFASAISALAITASELPKVKAQTNTPETQAEQTFKNGEVVEESRIWEQKYPPEEMQKIKEAIDKIGTGIVVSKKLHLHFLVVNKEIINVGIAGTANPNFLNPKGLPSSTPPGMFELQEKVAGRRKSGENGEFMFDTMFYDTQTGRAIHGSYNIFEKDGKTYIFWDNSHGCVNISQADAKIAFKTLNKSTKKAKVYFLILEK